MLPLVMGVVNVTPDSFSDGGRFLDHRSAVAHGLLLVEQGADVIDVGGESTRPGSDPVDASEQIRRVVPVVEALAPTVRVSIDTRHRQVAEAAIDAGATIINDTSASLHGVAADRHVGWVAMHMLGQPESMQSDPRYDDVVAEVTDFLVERAETAREAGVDEIWIDPGIGFGKTAAHNLTLLARISDLVATGWPVVVGTSRKAFLGSILARSDGTSEVPTDDRLEGSLATATWAMAQGAAMVRVHDVRPTFEAARIVAA